MYLFKECSGLFANCCSHTVLPRSEISVQSPVKKSRKSSKTQDEIVYAHIFDAILEQRFSAGYQTE